jgi:putative ABC transport system ATP-binding protein
VARGDGAAVGGDAVSAAAPLLEVRGVAVRYHEGADAEVRAIEDVSLVVPRGAFVAVSGPSGCGKTTLLSVLGMLLRPTAGAVLVDGRDASDASEAERSRIRRRIGFAFQAAPMLRGLPLWENVTYGLVPRGETAVRRREIARGLLERVGLPSKETAPPEELSGGERQRAGLARALCGAPDAILADEPTSNLDRASAAAILALLTEFHRGGGTVVVASHDPEALAPATSKLALEAGRVVRFAEAGGNP